MTRTCHAWGQEPVYRAGRISESPSPHQCPGSDPSAADAKSPRTARGTLALEAGGRGDEPGSQARRPDVGLPAPSSGQQLAVEALGLGAGRCPEFFTQQI